MTDPKPATPASTLVLLRESGGSYEIFMVERAKTMAFAGGMMAFPGGKVDASDMALAANPGLAPGFAALDPVDAAARIGAVRETFEEAGVLLTRGPSVADEVRNEWQPRITRHDADFGEFLAVVGHVLDPDLLIPFAHWCPPPNLDNRRFDTRFYLAVMPDSETALHDGGESVESHWVHPGEAIARAARGETMLIFPTERNLERLAQFATVSAVIDHARTTPVRLVQPAVQQIDGELWLTIPDGIGYPVTRATLQSQRRG